MNRSRSSVSSHNVKELLEAVDDENEPLRRGVEGLEHDGKVVGLLGESLVEVIGRAQRVAGMQGNRFVARLRSGCDPGWTRMDRGRSGLPAGTRGLQFPEEARLHERGLPAARRAQHGEERVAGEALAHAGDLGAPAEEEASVLDAESRKGTVGCGRVRKSGAMAWRFAQNTRDEGVERVLLDEALAELDVRAALVEVLRLSSGEHDHNETEPGNLMAKDPGEALPLQLARGQLRGVPAPRRRSSWISSPSRSRP